MSALLGNASLRSCAFRFISRYQVTTFSAVTNAKQSLQHNLWRSCSSLTDGQNKHTVKVCTGEDDIIQKHIDLYFMGRGGTKLKTLNSECDITVRDGFVSVSGPDVETVKTIAQRVSKEVKKIIDQRSVPFLEKVLTDTDEKYHTELCAKFIGKDGRNIKKLYQEIGINFTHLIQAGHIQIFGFNAEEVKIVAEKIQEEVQRIKKEEILPFSEKVFTDENEEVHNIIIRNILGKEGQNMERLRLEAGFHFNVMVDAVDYVLVSVADAEDVKKATEIVQHDIERIRYEHILHFSEKVFTDEDEKFHDFICGNIVGKGGEFLRKLSQEIGFHFAVETDDVGLLHVRAADAESAKIAAEKVQEEVQRLRNEEIPIFSEMVLTDEDEEIHNYICNNLVGIGGENYRRLCAETGLCFNLKRAVIGHVLVSGTNAQDVKIAAEEIQRIVQRVRLRKCSPFSEKVVTDEDEIVHVYICSNVVGKGGANIEKLYLEVGIPFQLETDTVGYINVVGADADDLKIVSEIIQQDVQKLRLKKRLPFSEKVATDEDEGLHDYICSNVIGRGRENLRKLRLEVGIPFHLETDRVGYINVVASDADDLEIVTEKIQQDVQRIRLQKCLPFSEKVVTDKQEVFHSIICGRLIGDGGINLRRLNLNTGLDFKLEAHCVGYVLVLGDDAEDVKKAAEKVQQEVRRLRKGLNLPVFDKVVSRTPGSKKLKVFTENVLTDERKGIHDWICSNIIGKGGENFEKLRKETGLMFNLDTDHTGHITVWGRNAKVVSTATEKVQEKVQKLKGL